MTFLLIAVTVLLVLVDVHGRRRAADAAARRRARSQAAALYDLIITPQVVRFEYVRYHTARSA